MIQVILGCIIVLLGFFVFKFYPLEKGNTKKMVMAAIFVMLTVIFKRLAIMIPLFGVESFKIGFEYIPLMIAGYLLGPSYAFMVGLTSDLLGLIAVSTSFPFLGFTLGTILVSVIPSLVKTHLKKINEGLVEKIAIALVAILAIGASLYIYFMTTIVIEKVTYVVGTKEKAILIALCLVSAILIIAITKLIRKRINNYEGKIFSTWLLSVVLVELVVTLILTPTWLQIMYNVPYFVSLCVRVVKECVILPIEIFIGYTLVQILQRSIFRNEL